MTGTLPPPDDDVPGDHQPVAGTAEGLAVEMASAHDDMEALPDASLAAMSRRFDKLQETLIAFIASADRRAQIAQDSLQALMADTREALRLVVTTEVLEARLAALSQVSELRDECTRTTIGKFEQSVQRRLDALSEFNQASNVHEQNYVTRTHLEARLDQVTERVNTLHHNVASYRGKILSAGFAIMIVLILVETLLHRLL